MGRARVVFALRRTASKCLDSFPPGVFPQGMRDNEHTACALHTSSIITDTPVALKFHGISSLQKKNGRSRENLPQREKGKRTSLELPREP
jgi:hypothetical protein